MSKACNRNIQSSTVDPAHAQVKPKLFKGTKCDSPASVPDLHDGAVASLWLHCN